MCIQARHKMKQTLGIEQQFHSLFLLAMQISKISMATPQFTPQQRAFLVSEYHCTQSVAEVLRRFHQAYPNVRQPSRGAVYKNVRKSQATGASKKSEQ